MAMGELVLSPLDRGGGDNADENSLFPDGEGCFSGADLLRSLPAVRRARDFRLYTGDGRRLTDLWQYGGRAVLGHTPPGVLRELKNAASRGLFAPFPGCYEGRLAKALSRLFPGRIVRLYSDGASLRRALESAGYDAAAPFPDPAFPVSRPGSAPPLHGKAPPVLWRPFLEDPLPSGPSAVPDGSVPRLEGAAPLMIPVLPLPLSGVPCVLILDRALEAAFPASGQDTVSPAVLAAAARSVWDLIAILPERSGRKFSRIRKALARSPWRRRGIYLTLADSGGEEDYAALFRRFLEKGFLLPPSPRCPLILPGELSPGEETALAECLSP